MIPNDWPAWIDRAVESGADVTITSETGGVETFSGNSEGPGQQTVGDDLRISIDGAPMVIDASVGRLEGGGYAATARGSAVTLDQATPVIAGAGVLMLAVAAWAVYRGSLRLAVVCGGFGVGLIAGALNPWLFAVALLALAGGVVFYFRDSIALGDARRALGAVVSEVERMDNPAEGPQLAAFKSEMRRRIGGDRHAKAEIKRARGVK